MAGVLIVPAGASSVQDAALTNTSFAVCQSYVVNSVAQQYNTLPSGAVTENLGQLNSSLSMASVTDGARQSPRGNPAVDSQARRTESRRLRVTRTRKWIQPGTSEFPLRVEAQLSAF